MPLPRTFILIAALVAALLLPGPPAAAYLFADSEPDGFIEYVTFPVRLSLLDRPPIGIATQWTSDLAFERARLLLDGVERPLRRDGALLYHLPDGPLATGSHDVEVVLHFSERRPLSVAWTFSVVDPVGLPAPADPFTGAVLTAANRFRSLVGLLPFEAAPPIQRAAVQHAAYLAAHPSVHGLPAHDERPGVVGFTGADVGERVTAWGWLGAGISEGIVLDPRPIDATRATWDLIHTVYHRLPFQDPGFTELGAGLAQGRFVVNFGQPADATAGLDGRLAAEPFAPTVIPYPAPGQRGLPLSWDGRETPDPLRFTPDGRPGGYPITALLACPRILHCYDEVRVDSATIRDGSATTVPSYVLTPDNDSYLRDKPAFAILPADALAPGTRYTVEASLWVRPHGGSGRNLNVSWWFTTGAASSVADRAHSAPDVSVRLDGSALALPVPAVIADGRVLLPVRVIAESLGAEVTWDERTQQVILEVGSRRVAVRIDNDRAVVDDSDVLLDVPPILHGERTLLPLRFLAESLDVTVTWHEDLRTVDIGR